MTFKSTSGMFSVNVAPDTVHEVFTHLMAMAPEVHDENDD
jgi:hypothetical protein